MLLHEAIEINDTEDKFILFESIHKYLRSLYVYYRNEFNDDEPILLVDSVTNATQYVKIVNLEQFNHIEESRSEHEAELMRFRSRMLNDYIDSHLIGRLIP